MEENKLRISILIPTYNSTDYVIDCVNSIFEYCDFSKLDKEIIIINDGSNEVETNKLVDWRLNASKKMPGEHCYNIILINRKANKGIGYSFNQGIKAAQGKYIIRFDSDTLVMMKDFDEKLIQFFENDEKLGLLTCMTSRISQKVQRIFVPEIFFKNKNLTGYMESLKGSNIEYHTDIKDAYSGFLFVFKKKDVVDRNIWFDTTVKCYMEDNKFMLDMLNAGLKCAVAKKLFLWHKYHGTTELFTKKKDDKLRVEALNKWKDYLEK